MINKIEYIGKDQDWDTESTTYWYDTDIGIFGILYQNAFVDIINDSGDIVSDCSIIYMLCCAFANTMNSEEQEQ